MKQRELKDYIYRENQVYFLWDQCLRQSSLLNKKLWHDIIKVQKTMRNFWKHISNCSRSILWFLRHLQIAAKEKLNSVSLLKLTLKMMITHWWMPPILLRRPDLAKQPVYKHKLIIKLKTHFWKMIKVEHFIMINKTNGSSYLEELEGSQEK